MIDHPGVYRDNMPMTVAQVLDFYFLHVETIIAIAVPVILALAALATYRIFKSSKDEELGITPGAGPDMSKLEEMLKAILEKAGNVPSASATAAGGTEKSGEAAALVEQIGTLKAELEKKAAEMEALKAAPAGATAAPGGVSDADKAALEAQLLELQKKLEEYDIIAQDIADLSFFKEENMRLQKELEGLKKTPGAAPSAAAPAAPAPAAAAPAEAPPVTPPPAAAEAPVPEVAPAAAAAPVEAAVSAPAADIELNPPVDSEVKKFNEEVVVDPNQPAASPAAAPDPAADSMLADWEAAVAEQKTAPAAPTGVDGNLDLDKMVAEAGALGTEPASAADSKALEQELDPEKLAAEADKLNEVPAEAKNDRSDFEKFINKGS